MTDQLFITDKQFCDREHIVPRTSARWRRDGDGPPFVRAGKRHVLYRVADVEAWECQHTFAHRAAEAVGCHMSAARLDVKETNFVDLSYLSRY